MLNYYESILIFWMSMNSFLVRRLGSLLANSLIMSSASRSEISSFTSHQIKPTELLGNNFDLVLADRSLLVVV